VLSKHSSTWETLALTMFFPPLAYVAKKELLSIPFFGWGFALASPITIDRSAGTDAMQQIAVQGANDFARGSGSSSIRKERGFAQGSAASTRPAARALRSSSASGAADCA
jgi:1-acyl-sn-glycerol-3-phosphate acyltransferase